MTYGDRLRKRWVVVRLFQGIRWIDVAGFAKYADAEGYLHVWRQVDPETHYEIVFEVGRPTVTGKGDG